MRSVLMRLSHSMPGPTPGNPVRAMRAPVLQLIVNNPSAARKTRPVENRVWKEQVTRIVTVDRFMGWTTAVGIRGILCAGLPSDVKVVSRFTVSTPQAITPKRIDPCTLYICNSNASRFYSGI